MSTTIDPYRQFIEDAGDMIHEHGLPHMAGRVVGALMVSESPHRSLDELAEDLRSSRGSISMATQLLLRVGVIERVSVPGERRHYYRIRSDVWASLFVEKEQHVERHIGVLEQGLALLEGKPMDTKQRLLELLAFFDFIAEEAPGFAQRWEARKSALLARRVDQYS